MNTMLKELLLLRCRKKFATMQVYDEEEEGEMEHEEVEGEEETDAPEVLPFEDILAEKVRKYTPKDEFVYLLYNDLLQYFVKSWHGTYLRKKPRKQYDDDSRGDSEEFEDFDSIQSYDDLRKFEGKDYDTGENSTKTSHSSVNMFWKLLFPDEYANITFLNNNMYKGRISRRMMEGEGVYKWSNGVQYKGEFRQNRIEGRGLLEWSSNCWYEGDFRSGHRHGRGIVVDGERRYMYTGEWCMGQRHGKGYCRYRNNDSYDGDWAMDKMNGTGLRIFASGARYVGQWKNGLRDGVGTMVWPDGSIYRGEWKCGSMNGYGELVWNGFFNETFTWPQEASYVGHWRQGMRHGRGLLKLNSMGGAKYSGYWKDNEMHGAGVIIGNNGEKFEADPLFLNDTLVSSDLTNAILKNEVEVENIPKCVRTVQKPIPLFLEKPEQLGTAPIIPILKPEQFPPLSYYITRLLDPQSLEPVVHFEFSGKCYTCENESCSCLLTYSNVSAEGEDEVSPQTTNSHESFIANTTAVQWEYEERWTYNCLTLHMPRLREIYRNYAKLFATSTPRRELIMSRLCLWQLWRDCGINKRGLSLADIDSHMAKVEANFIRDQYDPFEKIEIWKFLCALLEVSWHLYTKYDNVKLEDMNGRIAGGLHKFLKNDIYPNTGNHIGTLCKEYKDLLPVNCMFELYQQIGYPLIAKSLLRAIYKNEGTPGAQPSATTDETVNQLPDGVNSVTIGEKISYLLKFDGILTALQYRTHSSRRNKNNQLNNGLSVFKQLGAPKIIDIIAVICPGIKEASTGVIVNMDYKVTFLEFYEILLETTKEVLFSQKKAAQEKQMKKLEAEINVEDNNLNSKNSVPAKKNKFKK